MKPQVNPTFTDGENSHRNLQAVMLNRGSDLTKLAPSIGRAVNFFNNHTVVHRDKPFQEMLHFLGLPNNEALAAEAMSGKAPVHYERLINALNRNIDWKKKAVLCEKLQITPPHMVRMMKQQILPSMEQCQIMVEALGFKDLASFAAAKPPEPTFTRWSR